jgi:hypothetical protein
VRWRRRFCGRSALALLAVGVVAACQAPPRDPAWLVGAWTFGAGSAIGVDCGPFAQAEIDLAGTPVRIAEASAGVEVELGCRCRLRLTASGTLAGGGQICTLVGTARDAETGSPGPVLESTGTMDSWTITQSDDEPESRFSLATGTAEALNADGPVPVACSFTMSGPLRPGSSAQPRCGDDRVAVGVIPTADVCPVGAGRDGIWFRMADDRATGCTSSSSDAGQPPFLPADAVKPPLRCRPNRPTTPTTSLPFCRVDGRLFTPPPVEAEGAGHEYAVLKLGEECPPGSRAVSKYINNEDLGPTDTKNGAVGRIAPNICTRGEVGTVTHLHFCLFTPGAGREALTRGGGEGRFPDLGFPYAVFHDYEGLQPSWVMGKRWLLSDNESADPPGHNYYTDPSGRHDGADIELLRRMVEDASTDTTFDLARVR